LVEQYEIENVKDDISDIFSDVEKNDIEVLDFDGQLPQTPSIVQDKLQNLNITLPMQTFVNIANALQEAKQNEFNLELEREVASQLPIDFDDVVSVVSLELEKNKKDSVDIYSIVKRVKKQHPNLFVDINDLSKSFNDINSLTLE
jgi:hypothetical protein